ncbi:unnamed protein product [Hymenolepis diminuta]|uniref:Uncharacterized protein n=1 Tax=Hymenolepis diminuta TaxID=6216 RepID=A0A564YGN2_HYMDI|nr:unnamed protein product [Hymenolepis diminuta]
MLKNSILSYCKLPLMKIQLALLKRELSKTLNVSRHITIYREMRRLRWESVKGWEMGTTQEMRFVKNQQVTTCDLLCFTAFS